MIEFGLYFYCLEAARRQGGKGKRILIRQKDEFNFVFIDYDDD
jgi:hypothetical protein